MVTDIEFHDDLWVKREDLYSVYGAVGAKARAAYYLMQDALNKGYKSVVTAGSRKSPQISIISKIGTGLGINVFAFCPTGELGDELISAKKNGATIIQCKYGYNNVIIKRSKDYSEMNNYYYIPFGMLAIETINLTSQQVLNIPHNINKIVIPVGSGVNFCGLLLGLKQQNITKKLLGVMVGANPIKTLNTYLHGEWVMSNNVITSTHYPNATIIKSKYDYHKPIYRMLKGIELDPIYESKCVDFLDKNDLFWIVGKR